MNNDNKNRAIRQACEVIGVDFDDTIPVEVVSEGEAFTSDEIMMSNALREILRGLMLHDRIPTQLKENWKTMIEYVLGDG